MKKVLYDLYECQPTESSKFHGGGEYIKAIFRQITERFLEKIDLIVFYDKNKFMDQWVLDIINKENIKEYFISSRSEIASIFEKEKIDTFYSGLPYYYKNKYIPENVKFIGTIHGLRFLELPGDMCAHLYANGIASLKERIRLLLKNQIRKKKKAEFQNCIDMLDEIICVSNHTYYSLKKWFHVEKDINIICPPIKNASPCMIEESPIQEKFVLLLGGDRWIKNVYRAIAAMEILFSCGHMKDYKVVIVGRLNNKIKNRIHYYERYVFKDYVEAEYLEKLYKHCDIFVYPTLNEGFGLPPLEAMRYGTTCVTSGVCSLPEVCGDGVYYVNPYDIDEIAVRILLASEKKIPKSVVEKKFNDFLKMQKQGLDKVCEIIIS